MSDAAKIISNKIDDIIRQRKIKAEEVKKQREVFYEIKNLLNTERSLGSTVSTIKDAKLRDECNKSIKKAAVSLEFRKDLEKIIKQLDSAVARFERESINIATIGKEGQGKSRLLQSIGNIDNEIIPAYDATSCTGATSVIWNDSTMADDTVRAVISFRKPSEIVDIVKSYINIIDPNYLSENSIEFDDIPYLNIINTEEGNAQKATAYQHLSRIIDHFDEFRELFGAPPRTITDKREIKKFVAQNNGKGAEDPAVEYYYSYLAVSRADIYCPFFNRSAGKIGLVDTVGLGATQVGIEDAMLNTVDKECDAAIVVNRPQRGFQTGDTELYETLREKFEKRDMGKWLFYLVNHFAGQNDNVVDAFKNEITGKRLRVAGCEIVNVSDPKNVNEFLVGMLGSLAANMEEIDRAYLKELNDNVEAFKNNFKTYIDEMPKLDTSLGNAGVATYQMGVECYRKLTADLSQKVVEWYKRRNKPNAVLWSQIKDILDNLESVLPSEDEIQQVMSQAGNLIGDDIWRIPLNYVRNKITDQFIAIDEPMQEETLNFKNDIVEELYNTFKGLAGDDANDPEDNDRVKWIWNTLEPLIKDEPQYTQIYKALKFLDQFEFNVRAQLILEVRNQLEIINPMTPDVYMKPNFNFSKINAGKEIKFFMTSRIAILEDGLRHSLSKLNRLPNQAFYAAAEEVYDRLTFSSDLEKGQFVDMSTVWGNFFMQYGSVIFVDDLGKYEQLNELKQKYEAYQQSLREILSRI